MQAGIPLTYTLLTVSILAALRQPSIPIAIRASFKKVKIHPFDESKALTLCGLEEPQDDHDRLVDTVLEIFQERCDFHERKKRKAAGLEQRTKKLKGKKQFFSSKHAQVLTAPANIAYIHLDNDWKSVKEKKSAKLTE